jgi:hypothetical protein
MIDPTGWLRALDQTLSITTTANLPIPDDDEPYDPKLDAPFTIIQRVSSDGT